MYLKTAFLEKLRETFKKAECLADADSKGYVVKNVVLVGALFKKNEPGNDLSKNDKSSFKEVAKRLAETGVKLHPEFSVNAVNLAYEENFLDREYIHSLDKEQNNQVNLVVLSNLFNPPENMRKKHRVPSSGLSKEDLQDHDKYFHLVASGHTSKNWVGALKKYDASFVTVLPGIDEDSSPMELDIYTGLLDKGYETGPFKQDSSCNIFLHERVIR
ncbi:MAG: hypothetical protein KDJ35_05300 [Alphaproteobacteria bacterium]|nr:hypothetical protein [Alphaproteobacteria bacterium]